MLALWILLGLYCISFARCSCWLPLHIYLAFTPEAEFSFTPAMRS